MSLCCLGTSCPLETVFHLLSKTFGKDKLTPVMLQWEGEWKKLPRAVIVVGGLDILRGEGEQYAEKLRGAGVKTKVVVMEGMPHPFLAMDGVMKAGRDAITEMVEGLKAVFRFVGNKQSVSRPISNMA